MQQENPVNPKTGAKCVPVLPPPHPLALSVKTSADGGNEPTFDGGEEGYLHMHAKKKKLRHGIIRQFSGRSCARVVQPEVSITCLSRDSCDIVIRKVLGAIVVLTSCTTTFKGWAVSVESHCLKTHRNIRHPLP